MPSCYWAGLMQDELYVDFYHVHNHETIEENEMQDFVYHLGLEETEDRMDNFSWGTTWESGIHNSSNLESL